MDAKPTFFVLWLVATIACSGCLGIEDPGGALPLEVANRLAEPATVALEVREPFGNTVIFESLTPVGAGARERIDTPRLPFGTYIVAASHRELQREVEADFQPSTQFQRFVVHDEVIAFQSG